MRILVTGGSGFIGSHLVEVLLREDHAVLVQDDLSSGDAANLAHLADDSRLSVVHRDVADGIAFDGPVDRVYNLASPASPKDFATIPLEILRTGSEGTRNALEFAARHRARFLQASTSEVYGDPLVHPQNEDYWGNVNPTGERAVYDEAKRFGEAMASAYHRLGRVEVRIARIFNTYGPRMRLDDGRVLPNFVGAALRGEPLRLYGTGSQTRSFCFVADLVRGLTLLMESEVTGPVNLGRPVEQTIREFAEAILAQTGSASRLETVPLPHADDPKQRCPDIAKARSRLGWEPRVDLQEGLRLTLADFRARLGLGP